MSRFACPSFPRSVFPSTDDLGVVTRPLHRILRDLKNRGVDTLFSDEEGALDKLFTPAKVSSTNFCRHKARLVDKLFLMQGLEVDKLFFYNTCNRQTFVDIKRVQSTNFFGVRKREIDKFFPPHWQHLNPRVTVPTGSDTSELITSGVDGSKFPFTVHASTSLPSRLARSIGISNEVVDPQHRSLWAPVVTHTNLKMGLTSCRPSPKTCRLATQCMSTPLESVHWAPKSYRLSPEQMPTDGKT